jgi:hypothetical protein
VLGNAASGPDFVVPEEHAIYVGEENRPWLAYQFEEGGVTYNVWRINYYKRLPDYEELYDWAECSPCASDAYNAQRHWVGWDDQCLACFALQSSSFIGPSPGADVPSHATTLHFINIAWSDFYNAYRWFTAPSAPPPPAPARSPCGEAAAPSFWASAPNRWLGRAAEAGGAALNDDQPYRGSDGAGRRQMHCSSRSGGSGRRNATRRQPRGFGEAFGRWWASVGLRRD